MKVSWKQSSASSGPTEARRNRQTTSRCASRKLLEGWPRGAHARYERRASPRRETAQPGSRRSLPRRPSRCVPPRPAGAAPVRAGSAPRGTRACSASRTPSTWSRPIASAHSSGPRGWLSPSSMPVSMSARLADAFAEREGGLVDHLADDPPEHEARGVADPRDVLAERRKQPLGALGGERGGASPSGSARRAAPRSKRRQHVEADGAAARVERAERAPRAEHQSRAAPRSVAAPVGPAASSLVGRLAVAFDRSATGSTPPLGSCGPRSSSRPRRGGARVRRRARPRRRSRARPRRRPARGSGGGGSSSR